MSSSNNMAPHYDIVFEPTPLSNGLLHYRMHATIDGIDHVLQCGAPPLVNEEHLRIEDVCKQYRTVVEVRIQNDMVLMSMSCKIPGTLNVRFSCAIDRQTNICLSRLFVKSRGQRAIERFEALHFLVARGRRRGTMQTYCRLLDVLQK